MFVDQRVGHWLQWLGYGPHIFDETQEEADGVVALTPEFTSSLFSGHEFKNILERASVFHEIPFAKQQSLGGINSGETLAKRKYNWEVIVDFLAGIGFRIDPSMAATLSQNNEQSLRSFLGDLVEFLPYKDPETEHVDNRGTEEYKGRRPMGDKTFNDQFSDTRIGPSTTTGGILHTAPIYREEDVDKLDLQRLAQDKPLSELKSIPQILTLSMSRNFNMQPIQAASLLTNNSKFFSLLLAKGIKGDFDAINGFLRDMIDHVELLVDMAVRDPTGNSILRLLSAFKSGLVSKNIETARLVCKLYSRISHELLDKASLDVAYSWFVNPNSNGASVKFILLRLS
jgi:hypothetical protein